MKFITVRDLRASPAGIWRSLPEEQEMVITNNGKPVALLIPLSDETFEETLKSVRAARAQNAVRRIRRQARENGLDSMTMDDIQAEIDVCRAERRIGPTSLVSRR